MHCDSEYRMSRKRFSFFFIELNYYRKDIFFIFFKTNQEGWEVAKLIS